MKNYKALIHSLFIVSFMVFAVSCSDSDQGVTNSIDPQASINHGNANANNNVEAAQTKMYTADLAMLNGSGVSGTAQITLTRDELTVKIQASGLEANMLHPQHIHGFMANKRNSTCPSPSADKNMDGIVDLGEGAPFYGPVIQPLYVPIDTYPTADNNGDINYERTFEIGETEHVEEGEVATYSELRPLQNRAIVLHGMTVDNAYVATTPVACGQITSSQGQGNNK